jgi:asparagine synthase (glutamine-hydrolysing)
MTAIAGLWFFDGRSDTADCCARMLMAQKLYGPDDGAQWSDGHVALGLRLLRVLPEDAFDRQPLLGGGGRFALVADIRLDNRDELIEALGISASQARGLCDAAILLAAFERWDEACLERIVGDYAFAVWDSARQRIILARDPLGFRSLHYHRGNKFFAFASMPKGLHALREIPYVPDEERIAEFLILLPETGPKSFFVGIERVEPGHLVSVTASGVTTRRHWKPSESSIKLSRPEDYAEALRHLLDQAVRCRLRGNGDLVANLSGGLDSGAVVATAARLLAPTGRKLIAFTAAPREGYDGPAPRDCISDEAAHAAATAALYPNVEHILVRNTGRSPLDDLDRTFFLCDRPVFNLCTTGLSYDMGDVARRRNLRVLLGAGFGNYGLSLSGIQLLPELLVSGRWVHLLKEARALVASRRLRWRGVFANTFGPWCPSMLWTWLNKIAHGYALEIGSYTSYTAINPRRFADLDLQGRARALGLDLAYRPSKNGSRLQGLYSLDPGNFCKGTMGGWQLDFRDPTADVRLLEFCLAVPNEQLLRNGVPRALARQALADRLPKEVLQERRRGMQVVDWHENLTAVRSRVADELDRIAACPAATRALDLPRLRRLTENWPSGGWDRDDVRFPYRYALLRGISAGHFLRRATGANR